MVVYFYQSIMFAFIQIRYVFLKDLPTICISAVAVLEIGAK